MERKNENLILALAKFSESLWIPYEDSVGVMEIAIGGGMIDKPGLENEFLRAIGDKMFDWHGIAKESRLLLSPDNYSNVEILNYVKYLLFDFLFPDKTLTQSEVQLLSQDVLQIVQPYTANDGWIFSYDLHSELRKKSRFADLEYYDLWKVPYHKMSITRRPLADKEMEIGHLRYNIE